VEDPIVSRTISWVNVQGVGHRHAASEPANSAVMYPFAFQPKSEHAPQYCFDGAFRGSFLSPDVFSEDWAWFSPISFADVRLLRSVGFEWLQVQAFVSAPTVGFYELLFVVPFLAVLPRFIRRSLLTVFMTSFRQNIAGKKLKSSYYSIRSSLASLT
jgi:hypothetical protein